MKSRRNHQYWLYQIALNVCTDSLLCQLKAKLVDPVYLVFINFSVYGAIIKMSLNMCNIKIPIEWIECVFHFFAESILPIKSISFNDLLRSKKKSMQKVRQNHMLYSAKWFMHNCISWIETTHIFCLAEKVRIPIDFT